MFPMISEVAEFIAARRVLDTAASTPLDPVPTFLERDAAALPKNRFSLVRVPLFPFGHAFRAGSYSNTVPSGVQRMRPPV